jgi:hypothetical protein
VRAKEIKAGRVHARLIYATETGVDRDERVAASRGRRAFDLERELTGRDLRELPAHDDPKVVRVSQVLPGGEILGELAEDAAAGPGDERELLEERRDVLAAGPIEDDGVPHHHDEAERLSPARERRVMGERLEDRTAEVREDGRELVHATILSQGRRARTRSLDHPAAGGNPAAGALSSQVAGRSARPRYRAA